MLARARTKSSHQLDGIECWFLTDYSGTFHRMDVCFHRSGLLNFQRWIWFFTGSDTNLSKDWVLDFQRIGFWTFKGLVEFSQVWTFGFFKGGFSVFHRFGYESLKRMGAGFSKLVFRFFTGLDTNLSTDLDLVIQVLDNNGWISERAYKRVSNN